MSLPEISVVLPVRDGGRAGAGVLDAALASVRSQRLVGLEIVCVDDGSQDETPEILRHHAARDSRLRVISTPRLGLVSALNTGLAAARAALVARMDADDEMHPDRLALQRDFLAAHPDVGLCGCRVECFRGGGLRGGYRVYASWVNALVDPEAIEREAFVECPVPHPTWTFRRDLVQGLGGYHDEPWPEDLDLFYRLLASGARVGKVALSLHRWRDHDHRLSRSDPRYAREAFARAKARYLPELHPLRGAIVWGAGRTGRRFVRLLEERGVATRALVDVNPARVGTTWRGIPILPTSALRTRTPTWRQEGLRVLGAVASRGARSEIRGTLRSLGLEEGDDFLMVA